MAVFSHSHSRSGFKRQRSLKESASSSKNTLVATTPPKSPRETSPKPSTDTKNTMVNEIDNTAEFNGNVTTNNTLPTLAILKKIENLPVLDQDGKSIPFKSLYSGPHSARRVLVIFIRHFFCGNCQEYIRSLVASISDPSSLLRLQTPTSIAIIGCGSPSLIPMYIETTSCPFPIFADPTKKLYDELGMVRTLNLGARPEYQRKDVITLGWASFWQAMKVMKKGDALKGGDMHQVGGEFLFEPLNGDVMTPSPLEQEKQLGDGEEKMVTWCHRMRNTRDHAEIPELREVLGMDGNGGKHGKDEKRWRKALLTRKGTGLSFTDRSSLSISRKVGEERPAGIERNSIAF